MAGNTIQRYSRHFAKTNDEAPGDGSIRVTFFGTSTLLFDDGTTKILIDAFFTRPSLARILRGPVETDRPLVDTILKKHGMDRLDALFISHSHYDHALDAAHVAIKTGATLYGSSSTRNIGSGGGVQKLECFRTDVRADYPIGPKFVVTVLPSLHSPATIFNRDLGKQIDAPLVQPARACKYKEGNTVDFLIRHGASSILVKANANLLLPAAGEMPLANVLFLGVARLGNEDEAFREAYFAHTVAAAKPTLVVPIHWDDFFEPLSDHLRPPRIRCINDVEVAFDFLTARIPDRQFRIMQGFQSILLFRNGAPDIP